MRRQSPAKIAVTSTDNTPVKPLLKWAGGKGQLVPELVKLVPANFAGTYIEPFFGGGALFFALRPERAVISDKNPEIVNVYQQVADAPEAVIAELGKLHNDEQEFYRIRALDPAKLEPAAAAARTIYLNRTCYNGLYRVNRQGKFNTPFGNYKNPRIVDVDNIMAASALLKRATILSLDYKELLHAHARRGDFVFLDPPYLPVSQYSDFKRYTKEQFYEEDHRELAEEVRRLERVGCHVVLTNSIHPLVTELYSGYKLETRSTRRFISCDATKRTGEDVIVVVEPAARRSLQIVPQPLPAQVKRFPPTRYMGSKSKLLPHIWAVAAPHKPDTVLDLFAGSDIVSYMFKAQGKRVFSNDYMAMSNVLARAVIENNTVTLSHEEAMGLLIENGKVDGFVARTFAGIYYADADNQQIDILRANIKAMKNRYKRAIAMAALIRACVKKRPRGIFTYTGHRYDDGRRDIKLSLADQFLEAVAAVNAAVFDNGRDNKARCGDAMTATFKPDLVYIDPPYYSPLSDNEYVRRYHFVEGLARDWEGVEIQEHTVTKKFKSYPTPFSSRLGAAEAFDKLFHKFRDSVIIVSYSSNSLPTLDELVHLMNRHKGKVEIAEVDYKYSFGTQGHKVGANKNDVKEYLFIGS